jgi:hypothetical protein
MSEHKSDRDFQELQARVQRLEALLDGDRTVSDRRGGGVLTRPQVFSGVPASSAPMHWKAEKSEQLPPFMYSHLGVPMTGAPQFDLTAESTTWPWGPEPTILFVSWSGGGSDEYYRLQNQTFTKTRWTTQVQAKLML